MTGGEDGSGVRSPIAPGGAGGDPRTTAFAFPDSPGILAMGADLKASLCFARGGGARFAGGMGDLRDAPEFERYLETIAGIETASGRRPDLIACDAHPGFISTALARESGLPLLEVQHHHAHVASVMAEHGLAGPLVGVAMDGAGYGDDGAVWGCEFLICRGAACTRIAHLGYVPLVGGDQAARDAGQTAACHLLNLGLAVPAHLHPAPELLGAAIDAGVCCAASSSMGRLFDAVAALLGICAFNEREGQCAIMLQLRAEEAASAGEEPAPLAFEIGRVGGLIQADGGRIIRAASEGSGRNAGRFALGFHIAVANMVEEILSLARSEHGVRVAAFSGGVFQNALLLGLCREAAARAGLAVFVNERVPRGDGGIALGQAYAAACGSGAGAPAGG